MSRPKGFDPDVVLDAAMRTFWSRGYEATSAQDLVDGTGLGRGSLYHSFQSKHELFLRALRRYDDEWTSRQIAVLEGDGPVRERIRRVLMTVVDAATPAPDGPRGCFAVNTAIELADHDAEAARAVRRIFGRMEDAFCAALERARASGEIAPELEPRATARYLLNSMYGLRVTGKTMDRRALTGVVEMVLRSL